MTDRDLKPEDMPIIGWARPLGFTTLPPAPYCAVIMVTDSVLTSCRGRWSKIEPTHYIAGGPRREVDDDGIMFAKCGACDLIARSQAEGNPVDIVVAWPLTAPDWDLSDLGGES